MTQPSQNIHSLLLLLAVFCHSTSAATPCQHPVPGIAFDIDGVIRQGNRPCLEGLYAIVQVQLRQWPFVFLTNGGAGRTEEEYAIKLEKMLRSREVRQCTGTFDASPQAAANDAAIAVKLQQQLQPLRGEQFILAYSPLVELESMKNNSILVVGATGVERVARSYGFPNVLHANEYARRHPDQSPWYTNWVGETKPGCPGLRGDEAELHGPGPFTAYETIDTIFVMSEPNYFGQALELCVDFLLSTNPYRIELEPQQSYIVFANPDLLWRAEFPTSRLGLGAFKTALLAVYHARLQALGLSKQEIVQREQNRWIQLGKPMPNQYHFAERKMDAFLKVLQQLNVLDEEKDDKDSCIDRFYMIGDNHDTDIAGATATNNMVLSDESRRNWESVLVRTGVWRPGLNPNGATIIKDNAKDAVEWIIEKRSPRRKGRQQRETAAAGYEL